MVHDTLGIILVVQTAVPQALGIERHVWAEITLAEARVAHHASARVVLEQSRKAFT
jgi:hypothetical protein